MHRKSTTWPVTICAPNVVRLRVITRTCPKLNVADETCQALSPTTTATTLDEANTGKMSPAYNAKISLIMIGVVVP